MLPSVEGEDGHAAKGDELVRLQVTTRSPMGAIAYESGGLIVDHGWLRVLASGHHPRLPRSISHWTEQCTGSAGGAGIMLVGDDVAGGFFGLNGGSVAGVQPGHVVYLAPDTAQWESLDMGYSGFLQWALSGDLATFYADSRWQGWELEVQAVQQDRAFSFVPPLWAAGPPVLQRSRRPVPLTELFGILTDMSGAGDAVAGNAKEN